MKSFFSKSIVKWISAFLLFVVLVGAILMMVYYLDSSIGLEIDVDRTYQTIEGFGASAAWWSQDVGGYDNIEDYLQLLYGKDQGLGLTYYRYNVGAGSENDSTIYDPLRRSESFYIRESASYDFKDYANYDFTRDQNAVNAMKLAYQINPDLKIILFVNSPHYSLTKSGKAYADRANESNLPRENYEKYAEYLLTIAKYFIEVEGLPIESISPVNEPQWKWGGEDVSQEGCHFEPSECAELAEVFLKKRKEMHVDVEIEMVESGNIKNTKPYLKSLYEKSEIREEIPTFSVHAYGNDNKIGRKKRFGKYVEKNYADIKLAQTEWCHMENGIDNSIDAMIRMAQVMNSDLKYMRTVSWSFWLAVSHYDYNDGLVYVGADKTPELSARYYAMAHFSKYIDAGSVQVYTDQKINHTSSNVHVSAYLNSQNKLVIILINDNKSDVKIDLGQPMENAVWICSDQNKSFSQSFFSNQKITIPGKSVNTLVI